MAFSPFLSLPTELRFKIWQTHCPQLGPQPQILQVEFYLDGDEVRAGEQLWRQTAPVRAMLSLCADSRSHALRALPDTISLSKGAGLVRYLAARDLIRLDPKIPGFASAVDVPEWRPVAGFSDQAVNLAFSLVRPPWMFMSVAQYLRLWLSFPRLRSIFVTTWGLGQRPGDLAWIVAPQAHRVGVVLFEARDERVSDMVENYIWPDVPTHEDWARAAIPSRNMHHPTLAARRHVQGNMSAGQSALEAILDHTGGTLEGLELEGTVFGAEELAHLRKIRVWPMVSLPGFALEEMEDTISTSGVEALPPAFPSTTR